MKKWLHRLWILGLILAALTLAGCNDSDSDGGNQESETTSQSVPDFGGSLPKGDYVTAEIERDAEGNPTGLTVTNHTNSTFAEQTLSFDSLLSNEDAGGFSFVRQTEANNQGDYYFVVFIEDEVLGMQKMDGGTDTPTGQPYFMFAKEELQAEDLQDRVFSFLQFRAGGTNPADGEHLSIFEAGAVGFDTDDQGTFYGAAYDSEDNATYSITEDGITAAALEEFEDGSLVMWEEGVNNWGSANTFTGTTAGPIVIDFGPENGGGAGFAIEQADIETSSTDGAEAWWNTVGGTYFLIEYDSEPAPAGAVNYYKIEVSGAAGSWNGTVAVTDLATGTSEGSLTIQPLQVALPDVLANVTLDNGTTVNPFSNAVDPEVAAAYKARGVFKVVGEHTYIGFDPEGNYLAHGSDDGVQVTFGLAIKDAGYEDGAL